MKGTKRYTIFEFHILTTFDIVYNMAAAVELPRRVRLVALSPAYRARGGGSGRRRTPPSPENKRPSELISVTLPQPPGSKVTL